MVLIELMFALAVVGFVLLIVPVLVLTHPADESALRAALERIDALPDVTAPTRLVRIEERL